MLPRALGAHQGAIRRTRMRHLPCAPNMPPPPAGLGRRATRIAATAGDGVAAAVHGAADATIGSNQVVRGFPLNAVTVACSDITKGPRRN